MDIDSSTSSAAGLTQLLTQTTPQTHFAKLSKCGDQAESVQWAESACEGSLKENGANSVMPVLWAMGLVMSTSSSRGSSIGSSSNGLVALNQLAFNRLALKLMVTSLLASGVLTIGLAGAAGAAGLSGQTLWLPQAAIQEQLQTWIEAEAGKLTRKNQGKTQAKTQAKIQARNQGKTQTKVLGQSSSKSSNRLTRPTMRHAGLAAHAVESDCLQDRLIEPVGGQACHATLWLDTQCLGVDQAQTPNGVWGDWLQTFWPMGDQPVMWMLNLPPPMI